MLRPSVGAFSMHKILEAIIDPNGNGNSFLEKKFGVAPASTDLIHPTDKT